MPLIVPDRYPAQFKFMAVDPGTNFLGISVFTIQTNTLEIVSIESSTMVSEYLFDPYSLSSSHYTERFQKFLKIKFDFLKRLEFYNPLAVICEAPFYNRLRPTAFAPLAELLQGLRIQTHEFDSSIYFYIAEPSVVKKSIGAGHISGKDEVRAAILKHPEVCQKTTIPIDLLDEHAIDSLAVGLTYLNWLRTF
jgi:Holliday junction resolvasome RuvABC endonuclease subunit